MPSVLIAPTCRASGSHSSAYASKSSLNGAVIEAPLSDVHPQRQGTEVTDTAVDRASGVEICHTMLIRRTGQAWAMPAADKKDAEINASAIHDFLAGQT